MRLRQRAAPAETRDAIKRTARRLFAERGIDGVSVKEIVLAAGQRNGGSLHYHFKTKESLVRELVSDGAKRIDQRRNVLLDGLEEDGRVPTLREVIKVLVLPSSYSGHEDGIEDTYLRFITILQLSHRPMFLDALDQWNSGYLRCLAHIRDLLESSVPGVILNQRLVFMGIYLPSVMAAREGALDVNHGQHHFWSSPYTLENFIDSIESLIRGPVSAGTQRLLPDRAARKRGRKHAARKSPPAHA